MLRLQCSCQLLLQTGLEDDSRFLRLVIQDRLHLFSDLGRNLWNQIECLQLLVQLFGFSYTEDNCACVWHGGYIGERELDDARIELFTRIFRECTDLVKLSFAFGGFKLCKDTLEDVRVVGEPRAFRDAVVVLMKSYLWM